MFGGTPTNIASMFLEEGQVEVVTGVNLPMVIKLASQEVQGTLNETARRVCDLGRQGIYVAGELLTPRPRPVKAKWSSAPSLLSANSAYMRERLPSSCASPVNFKATFSLNEKIPPKCGRQIHSECPDVGASSGTRLRATAKGPTKRKRCLHSTVYSLTSFGEARTYRSYTCASGS
jgi:hypothetical protein